MTDSTEREKKRFLELARRAYSHRYYTFTGFLGLSEQSLFSEITGQIKGIGYEAFGGTVGAERVVIRFGSPEDIGYTTPYPIVCLKAEPRSQKFADRLTHRDFLGALLNLGIERDTLGDIIVKDNVGYIFALEEMGDYIQTELSKVKHTDVTVSIIESPPTDGLYNTELCRIQISSERLDAVLARVYHLSREDAQALFKKKLVYVNGRLCESVSHTPRVGDKISVRGYGRVVYHGYDSLSKKGKLNATVEVYL